VALHEAIDAGWVNLDSSNEDISTALDPVAGLRNRARGLLDAWTNTKDAGLVSIADQSLTTTIVASAGSFEITVHGWDIAQSCGGDHPIPAKLAAELCELAPLFVTPADRPARFAAPLDVSPLAGNSEKLLAFLGRNPW
jgi:hypothetical protein